MSENNKEYWDQTIEQGNIKIADDVIASIAALATVDVEGVHGLSSGIGTDIAEFFGKKTSTKGIKTRLLDNCVEIDIFIVVEYGVAVCDVAKEIQAKVSVAVEDMAGIHVSAVNVSVTGIVFQDEQTAQASQQASQAN